MDLNLCGLYSKEIPVLCYLNYLVSLCGYRAVKGPNHGVHCIPLLLISSISFCSQSIVSSVVVVEISSIFTQ